MPFKVKMTVIKTKGRCIQGHKVGDKVIFDGPVIKGKLCPVMLASSVPMINAIRFGARFPFSNEKHPMVNACPDGLTPVWFKFEPAGLTESEPFYNDAQVKLLEKIKTNPGIPVNRLLSKFTKEEKKEYSLTQGRIRVYLEEMAEVKQIEIRSGKAFPLGTKHSKKRTKSGEQT